MDKKTFLAILAIGMLVIILGTAPVQAVFPQRGVSESVALLPQFPPDDQTPRMLILSAYKPELEGYLEFINVEKTYQLNGRTVYVGTMEGLDVIATLSGTSMTNAAISMATLLAHFTITHVVFTGIAGGIADDLPIGTVTFPDRTMNWAESLWAREAGYGSYKPPRWFEKDWGLMQAEGVTNLDWIFPQPVYVTQKGGPPDEEVTKIWFEFDKEMLTVAKESLKDVSLKKCNAEGVCLEKEPKIVFGGNGVSGPVFMDNARARKWLQKTLHPVELEMETAAVAQACYIGGGVPIMAIRALSDLAGGGEGENEIGLFFQVAADNGGIVLQAFMKGWYLHTHPQS
jgi:adenosylhomocysteine nucleosidase